MIMHTRPTHSCTQGELSAEVEEAGRGIVSVAIAVPPKVDRGEIASTGWLQFRGEEVRAASRLVHRIETPRSGDALAQCVPQRRPAWSVEKKDGPRVAPAEL